MTWCTARTPLYANFWSSHCRSYRFRCMVLSMNRASLDVVPPLLECERHGELALSDLTLADLAVLELESRAVRDLVGDDPRQRRLDMQAVIGIWADREDLAETEALLRNLREDDRSERLLAL